MPKKSFKKARSLYRRGHQTQKAAANALRDFLRRRTQTQRQKKRTVAREGKMVSQALENSTRNEETNWNTNNDFNWNTNEESIENGIPPPSEPNVNTNNEVYVGPEWNGNVPGYQRVKRRVPSKTVKKAKRNLLQTRKQQQRERERLRRVARQGKEAERTLESVNLSNIPVTVESGNNNVESLTTEQREALAWDEEVRFYEEQERYEREMAEKREQKAVAKAKDMLAKAKKNTFYIRVFDYFRQDTPLIDVPRRSHRVSNLIEYLKGDRNTPKTIEILYLDEDPTKSYYKKIKWYVEKRYNDNDNNNNDYPGYGYFGDDYYGSRLMRGRYRNYHPPRKGWEVYNMPPYEYFREFHYVPNYLRYNENENENDKYQGTYEAFLRTVANVRAYILQLPGFKEKIEAERRAPYTAPAKLESLQLKGLEGSIQAFEKKTGRTVPRNVQDIIEKYMMRRPPPSTYYEQRNNIYRIDPTLFTNE